MNQAVDFAWLGSVWGCIPGEGCNVSLGPLTFNLIQRLHLPGAFRRLYDADAEADALVGKTFKKEFDGQFYRGMVTGLHP